MAKLQHNVLDNYLLNVNYFDENTCQSTDICYGFQLQYLIYCRFQLQYQLSFSVNRLTQPDDPDEFG